MDLSLKSSFLLFVAASILTAGGPACAQTRAVDAYFARASEVATAKLAAEHVAAPAGLKLHGRVDAEGRFTALRVVESSGSADLDRKAAATLTNVRIAAPPMELVGAEVDVAVGPSRLFTASAF